MDKLLPTGEHEEADERNRRMAEAQNPSDVLEAVETGANPVLHLSGIASGRMAGARAVEQSKMPMESRTDAQSGVDKRNTDQAWLSVHA